MSTQILRQIAPDSKLAPSLASSLAGDGRGLHGVQAASTHQGGGGAGALGKTAKLVSKTVANGVNLILAHDAPINLHSEARYWMTYHGRGRAHRCTSCGRVAVPGKTIDLVRTGAGGAYFAGLQRCGSKTICPSCARAAAANNRDKLAAALAAGAAAGLFPVFVTLTMRHGRDDDARANMDILAAARRAMFQGRGGAALARHIGKVHHVAVLESTWGDNGAHLHYHCIIWLDITAARAALLDDARAAGEQAAMADEQAARHGLARHRARQLTAQARARGARGEQADLLALADELLHLDEAERARAALLAAARAAGDWRAARRIESQKPMRAPRLQAFLGARWVSCLRARGGDGVLGVACDVRAGDAGAADYLAKLGRGMVGEIAPRPGSKAAQGGMNQWQLLAAAGAARAAAAAARRRGDTAAADDLSAQAADHGRAYLALAHAMRRRAALRWSTGAREALLGQAPGDGGGADDLELLPMSDHEWRRALLADLYGGRGRRAALLAAAGESMTAAALELDEGAAQVRMIEQLARVLARGGADELEGAGDIAGALYRAGAPDDLLIIGAGGAGALQQEALGRILARLVERVSRGGPGA